MAVAEQEIGGIHQHAAVALGGHREAPEHRPGKGVLNRAALGGVGARGTERLVGLDQQHLGPDALERHDFSGALLAAIEADVVRPQAGGQTGGVQEIHVEARDLEPQAAGSLVPIKREVAIQLQHAAGAFVNGRRASGWGGGARGPRLPGGPEGEREGKRKGDKWS